MAMPPSSGIGLTWTFRGPGWSTIPKRKARWRTGTVRPRETSSATAKAIRSTGIGIARKLHSACGQHILEDTAHLLFLLAREIPVHRFPQTVAESRFRFP